MKEMMNDSEQDEGMPEVEQPSSERSSLLRLERSMPIIKWPSEDRATNGQTQHPVTALDRVGNGIENGTNGLIPFEIAKILQEGHWLLQAKHIEQAIERYRWVQVRYPQMGEVYQYLAEALSQQGKLAEAAECYRKAIQLITDEVNTVSFQEATERGAATSVEDEHVADEYIADEHVADEHVADEHVADEHVADKKSRQLAENPPAATLVKPAEKLPWFEEAAFHLQQGEAYCNQAQWESAITACSRAIAILGPRSAMAYRVLGRALQGQGNLTDAEDAYSKSLSLHPDSAETHARIGSLYEQQCRFVEAADRYQTSITLEPNFAGAYWKLAEVWQRLGEAEKSAQALYKALQMEPGWASSQEHLQLGHRLVSHGKLEQAIDCYRRAIALDPALAESYHNLADLLMQQGQLHAALECHQLAVEQNPQDWQLHYGLGKALAACEQWEAAAASYRLVLDHRPDHLEGVIGLRDALVKLERWEEALPYYRQLADRQVDGAQHELGDVLSRLGRWHEAITAFRRSIDQTPDFSWSYNNLGDALSHVERWSEAATAYRQAIELNPDFYWSHYNLGEALAQLKQWDTAIVAYRQALELQPDMPYVHQKLGDALRQRAMADLEGALGCYYQAIQQDPEDEQNYHKALAIKPHDPALYQRLSEALTRQNKLNGAIVFSQMAKQLQPHSEPGAHPETLAIRKVPSQLELLSLGPTSLHDYWFDQNTPTSGDLRRMAQSLTFLKYQPLLSVVMPVYNPPAAFLREAIESVLQQIYGNWEFCIADDASTEPHVRSILEEYAAKDTRIKVVFRTENGHISAASNSALAIASGEFITLLDHDDVLTPDALYEVIALLNQHPEADLIYSDEDKLDEQGRRTDPYLKPSWCPDSLLSRMYICHLGTYRRSLIERIGGFRIGYEGAQDFDLALRFTEQTDRIFHIPKILYHWRIHAVSAASGSQAKPYAYIAGYRAINDALHRRGEPGRVVEHPHFKGFYTVRYQIQEYKLVSIIIPTRNLGKILNQCLKSIFSKSTYPNYEVILIDNGSDEPETLDIIESWKQREPERFRCFELDIPFNYSRINNYAVEQARGEYLLFLNNDTEVIALDWIEGMVEQAQRSSIGAVGAQLLYPDDTIQHAGVVMGLGGAAGHAFYTFPADHPGAFGQLITINNYSVVTAACLMCRRQVFEQVGGFEEQLAIAYNDVDLCLKIAEQGYRNVYLPHVQLYHHESKSRGYEDSIEKQQRLHQETEFLKQRWEEVIRHDPCYNPHLTRTRADYSISLFDSLDIQIMEIDKADRDTETVLDFSIDSPQPDSQAYSEWFIIAGWVLGKQSAAVAVELLSQEFAPQVIPINLARPDVALAYPNMDDTERCGFSAVLNITAVPSRFAFTLQVVFEDGHQLQLATIELQRKDQFRTRAKPVSELANNNGLNRHKAEELPLLA